MLFVNDSVGIIDLVMDPRNPQRLYAATYDKQRLPWQIVNGGPGSGIYKTTDGGKTWTKLAGGLPAGTHRSHRPRHLSANPDILYAVIENENPRTTPLAAAGGAAAAAPRPGVESTIGGEVYRTDERRADAGRR